MTAVTMAARLRAWLILGRVSNLPTVWTNVLVAWLLAGGGLGWSSAFAWLLLGTSLLYVGGTTLNDYFDAAFDREYRKERPIPSGVLTRAAVGVGSALYLIGGGLAVGLGAGGSWIWLGCLVAAIVFYDYRHKEWVGSVFVMGACRLFLVLVAGSCVGTEGPLPLSSWIHATSLFVYIVGLTFTARGESRHAAPVGWYTGLLAFPVVGALVVVPMSQPPIASIGVALFAVVVIASLNRLERREDPARIGKAVALMLAGIALLDAAFLGAVHWLYPLIGLAGFILARFLQRFVPAT